MATYIKNRQKFAPVPIAAGVTRQEFVVEEDGVEVHRGDVAFDPATGEATPPLPEYWAKVGATITRRLTYFDAAGNASDPFADSYVQVDNYNPPAPPKPPAPTDLSDAEQVDEEDRDEPAPAPGPAPTPDPPAPATP